MKLKRNKRAFTIIELLVVIAILGVLVLLATPKFLGYVEKANLARIKSDVKVAESVVGVELIYSGNLSKWGSSVDVDLEKLKLENKLYDTGGSVAGQIENGPYWKIDQSEFKSKLEGNFYANQGGKVYYEDIKKAGGVIKNEYTVTFLDHDGKVLKKEIVKKGQNVNPPLDPTREGYKFISWDKEFDNIVENLEVKAIYETIYVLANFQWVSNSDGYEANNEDGKGYYKYVGSGGKVIIPHEIKGHPMTSYYRMFYNSEDSLTGVTSSNKNVTDMRFMFDYSRATELDLSSFDTSNVTNMVAMFQYSRAASLDLSSFDTSNVINMGRMFSGSQATTLDLSSFDTSKVKYMRNMFMDSRATSLNLSSFDTSNVTDMEWMFLGSQATSIIGLNKFDTSNVTNMYRMFHNSLATSLDLSSFDTSNVTSMSQMFYGSRATEGYARTIHDANKLNNSSDKPAGLIFVVK